MVLDPDLVVPMALHGTVTANTTMVLTWEARRLEDGSHRAGDGWHDYQVTVMGHEGVVVRSIVRHRYLDGAGQLASRVLSLVPLDVDND